MASYSEEDNQQYVKAYIFIDFDIAFKNSVEIENNIFTINVCSMLAVFCSIQYE
jgi:hypothetical protein